MQANPMIRIMCGPRAVLRRHPAVVHPADGGVVFHLAADPTLPIPWAGARGLLALLRMRFGDKAAEDALGPHRVFLSLVMRGLVERLTTEELQFRAQQSALYLGFLPNAHFTSRPLTEAWAAVFSCLFAGRDVVIVIPDLACFDLESMALLRPILRQREPDQRLRVILGYDPDFRPPNSLWRHTFAVLKRELVLLQGLPDTVVERLTESASVPSAADETSGYGQASAPLAIDPLDDGLEQAAWRALDEIVHEPHAAACELVLRGIRAAFGAFGFPTALGLAHGLLERQPTLTLAAEFHAIAALSACYIPPVPSSNDELAQLAIHHLSCALATETDPFQQIHLRYRLGMLTARTQKDYTTALHLADRSVLAAQTAARTTNRGAYFEAWARNGRAYALMRLGRMSDAAADCEAALEVLHDTDAALDVPAGEVAVTRAALLNNLARLSYEAGDLVHARHWQSLYETCEAEIHPFKRSPYSWLSVRLADHHLADAVNSFTARLIQAQYELNPSLEALCAHALGDLYYRLGEAKVAYKHFDTALRIWRVFNDHPEDILTAELNRAVAAFRADLLDAAQAGFERVLRHPLCAESVGPAEVLGALAMIAARRGDGRKTEELLQEALSKAYESSEQDVLIRVTCSAGNAYLALNRRADARQAFRRALASAQPEDTTADTSEVPAEDLLSVLVGLQACGDDDPRLTLEAVLLAPTALKDVNAWWDLPRLLPYVTRLAEDGLFVQEEPKTAQLRATLQCLQEAAAQRRDCAEALIRLQQFL